MLPWRAAGALAPPVTVKIHGVELTLVPSHGVAFDIAPDGTVSLDPSKCSGPITLRPMARPASDDAPARDDALHEPLPFNWERRCARASSLFAPTCRRGV